jgi:hypothetical protein
MKHHILSFSIKRILLKIIKVLIFPILVILLFFAILLVAYSGET